MHISNQPREEKQDSVTSEAEAQESETEEESEDATYIHDSVIVNDADTPILASLLDLER
jgi:hypothetical protein